MQHLLIVLVAAASLAPGGAAAQVASDTARCVNAINKGMRKITLAAGKEVRGCVAQHAGGELTGSVAECVAAAPKVQQSVIGALIAADGACGGLPPAFGPPSISAFGARSVALVRDLLVELFGATPESALAPDATVMSCQTAVLKTAGRASSSRSRASAPAPLSPIRAAARSPPPASRSRRRRSPRAASAAA
jgi:hypothetical protein